MRILRDFLNCGRCRNVINFICRSGCHCICIRIVGLSGTVLGAKLIEICLGSCRSDPYVRELGTLWSTVLWSKRRLQVIDLHSQFFIELFFVLDVSRSISQPFNLFLHISSCKRLGLLLILLLFDDFLEFSSFKRIYYLSQVKYWRLDYFIFGLAQ